MVDMEKIGKFVPSYSEQEIKTSTLVVRAVVKRVERGLAEQIRRGKTFTDQQVEDLVSAEWKKVKEALAYWEDLRQSTEPVIQALNILNKVLKRVRSNNLGIKDTLGVSSYRDF